MKARGVDDGHIIHIGSLAGHVYPNMHEIQMYAATKHAVRVLTEGLRRELVSSGSKIRVSAVSPGVVRTEFASQLPSRGGAAWWRQPHLFAEDVADAALYALRCPPHVQIHDILMWPIS
ncbi:hypothetical protein R5R35_009522 [Gryllus longicercus]|uniref:Short-chain dehydrogenase n=1 Tax=Gryllus longicercus TaxID=2509291 RepID=A0AAN9VG39_9ORTH